MLDWFPVLVLTSWFAIAGGFTIFSLYIRWRYCNQQISASNGFNVSEVQRENVGRGYRSAIAGKYFRDGPELVSVLQKKVSPILEKN